MSALYRKETPPDCVSPSVVSSVFKKYNGTSISHTKSIFDLVFLLYYSYSIINSKLSVVKQLNWYLYICQSYKYFTESYKKNLQDAAMCRIWYIGLIEITLY